MLGDSEASLYCKCLPWVSKGIQGWGKGQPAPPPKQPLLSTEEGVFTKWGNL